MAKKGTTRARAVAQPVAAEDSVITCNGYRLTANNGPDEFILELNVVGHDAKQYHLRVRSTNDRTELVQELLEKMATLWPAFDWHFRADASKEITEIV